MATARIRMTLGRAREIAGTLSFPSKMPGTSYSLPAEACRAGSKLARVPGSACSVCYALRGGGFYRMGNAPRGMARRLAALDHPQWIEAMVKMLSLVHRKPFVRVDLGVVGVRMERKGTGVRFRLNETGFHRWHDSGDLQSEHHLANICEVARRTPTVRHWLPTQELGIVRRYLAAGGSIPRNMLIRVSSVMVNDARSRSWPHTSSVIASRPAPAGAVVCPAPENEHRCMDCRACWDRNVTHVSYRLH